MTCSVAKQRAGAAQQVAVAAVLTSVWEKTLDRIKASPSIGCASDQVTSVLEKTFVSSKAVRLNRSPPHPPAFQITSKKLNEDQETVILGNIIIERRLQFKRSTRVSVKIARLKYPPPLPSEICFLKSCPPQSTPPPIPQPCRSLRKK